MPRPQRPFHASLLTLASLALGLFSAQGCTIGPAPNTELFTVEDAYAQMESDAKARPQTAALSELDGLPCTLEARPAVVVNVFRSLSGELGSAGEPDVVLYRVWLPLEGWSEVRSAECADDDCSAAPLGYGEPGLYESGAYACSDSVIARAQIGDAASSGPSARTAS